MSDDVKVLVIERPEENHEMLVRLAMSVYLGERCKYCGREYKTFDDLRDTVWAGAHEHGRLMCRSCWEKVKPSE